MRWALIVGIAVLVAAAAAAGIGPACAQSGYDRPGGDYTSAAVANGDPAVCAMRCERDRSCRSWSFSYPAWRPAGRPCARSSAKSCGA